MLTCENNFFLWNTLKDKLALFCWGYLVAAIRNVVFFSRVKCQGVDIPPFGSLHLVTRYVWLRNGIEKLNLFLFFPLVDLILAEISRFRVTDRKACLGGYDE